MANNEENAIVNNSAKDSETPSELVAEGGENELSPNPAGFGFTKQLFVDALPENGQPNVLYLVNVYNNGTLIGYRKYKWTPSDGFIQFGATPDLKLEDGGRETPVEEVNEPRKEIAKVFNGDVAIFGGTLFIDGKPVVIGDEEEGDIDNIDSIEFENVNLLEDESGYYAQLELTEEKWAKMLDKETYLIARFTLTSNHVIELHRIAYFPDSSTVAFGAVVGDTTYYAIFANSTSLQGTLYEWTNAIEEINESDDDAIDLNYFKYKKEVYHIPTLHEIGTNYLADAYDSSSTYDVGDIVIYGNVLYQCNTAITSAEAWESSKWTAIRVADIKGTKLYKHEIAMGQTYPLTIISAYPSALDSSNKSPADVILFLSSGPINNISQINISGTGVFNNSLSIDVTFADGSTTTISPTWTDIVTDL